MSNRPILVTGMPRSGTTWVARQLAASHGAALTGREPMNARDGQYALGGTLDGWTRLTDPTPKQRRLLRRSYRGLNPWVYSRYGHRQWAAPFPSTRIIVKDPFAVLSLPTIQRETGARPVLVFRHPGAVLASFRRMGWAPDPGELAQLEALAPSGDSTASRPTSSTSDLELVARMWNVLHRVALDDLDALDDTLVVSHQDLAGGGDEAIVVLRAACGLESDDSPDSSSRTERPPDEQRLHNLDRDPREVAEAWRGQLDPDDVGRIESLTDVVASRLRARSLHVDPSGT